MWKKLKNRKWFSTPLGTGFAWCVVVLMVFFLYLLSYGPVPMLFTKKTVSPDGTLHQTFFSTPQWVVSFYSPAATFVDPASSNPLKTLYSSYCQWWIERIPERVE